MVITKARTESEMAVIVNSKKALLEYLMDDTERLYAYTECDNFEDSVDYARASIEDMTDYDIVKYASALSSGYELFVSWESFMIYPF